jgi:hypothetical protein
MCVVSRTIALWTLALLAVAPPIVAAPGRRVAADPLLPLLQEEDAQSRAQVLARLEQERRPPCQALRRYATSPNSRVRESAVRIMDAAACSDFEAYSGYLLDNAAGVVDALIDASRRRVMADAVPFLLGCLSDRRRIVTQEGAWSIGEKAQRALMVVTCQSFHYDPAAPRDDQRDAITRWRQWFLARRKLPRDEWVQEGIERGRDYAGRDYGPHRLEGLRLLALIGPPALPALREVLARRPGDLSAEVVCLPDEPPRPGDVVPCALVVRNASKRPLAIAPPPDGPQVRLSPDGARFEDDGSPARRAAPPGGESRDALGALADRLVDLAPGEVRRFEFGAGPVLTAGHYRLHVELDDLAARLPESQKTGSAPRTAAASGAIEADTMVRFEQ